MSYEVIYDEKALAYLEKQRRELRERIVNKIGSAKHHPTHYFKRLSGRPEHVLRVGDYRVIADIDHEQQRIAVLLVGHRKNIYDR